MGGSQQYSLRWNNYLHHITDAFGSLRTGEDLVDVTLSCEGKRIRAHKMLLSACSSYFRDLFKENPCQHPVIIFRNVKHEDLVAIIDFMYQGEVNVAQEQLASFLATAELLAIKGLTDGSGNEKNAGRETEEAILSPSPVIVEDDESESVVTKPVISSSQSFIPTNNRPASPQQRKRKYSIPSVPPSQSNNFIDKKKCTLSSSNSVQEDDVGGDDDDDSIEVIPMIPNVKIEKQEFFDDSFENINDETQSTVNSLHTILRNCDPSVKLSATEFNSINSSSSLQDVTSGEIVDMEQVLMEPGTSNEILPQDSMQGFGLEPDYPCTLCEKRFKHPNSVRQHMHAHLGETQCPECHKIMSRKYDLRAHMRKHHNIYTV